MQWALGDLTIPPSPKGESTVDSEPDPFDVKPEIVHQHRPPSKRVPGVIALAGAALCMAPLAYCGVLLLGMKANLKVGRCGVCAQLVRVCLGCGTRLEDTHASA